MIEPYNHRQTLRALLAFAIGLAATAFTAAFFNYGVSAVCHRFGREDWASWAPAFAAVAMIGVFWTGWDLWRRGFGHQDFLESEFSAGFDRSTASGWWANQQTADARGASYLISQVALAAPLQLLKGFDLLRSRIEIQPGLNAELEVLLEVIRRRKAWHPISDYGQQSLHVAYLIRMGKVDFSPRKGVIKAVA